jgi:hypothetical protein
VTIPQIFKLENGYISGAGFQLGPTTIDGGVMMNADLLNRLVALLVEQRMLGDDDAKHVLAQERRERARIEAAKADLSDDLDLDLNADRGPAVTRP